MTFPTFSGDLAVDDSVSLAWKQTRLLAKSVKDQVTAMRDGSAAHNVTATDLLTLISSLADARDLLAVRSAEDIVSALKAVIAQVDTTIGIIRSVVPVDSATNRLLIKTWNGTTGRTVDIEYLPAELAAMRAQIDALLATMV